MRRIRSTSLLLSPEQRRFVDEIRSKIGPARVKRLYSNGDSSANYQVLVSWEDGAKITEKALAKILDHLVDVGSLSAGERHRFEVLAEEANRARPVDRRGELPENALTPSAFLRRLEAKSIDLKRLADPQAFVQVLDELTVQPRATKNVRMAMRWAWHLTNFLTGSNTNLSLGDQYRFEAAAYAAWFMSWMALQVESVSAMGKALEFLTLIESQVSAPSIRTAKYTAASYRERITHGSEKYPNVDFARLAYANCNDTSGIFAANLNDPLIEYNACNELRLLGHPLSHKVDLFNGRTLEQELQRNLERANELGRDQEAMRIKASWIRGLIREQRFDEAEVRAFGLDKQLVGTPWLLSSRANALHLQGVLELTRGSANGEDALGKAAAIYASLGAERRMADVLSDQERLGSG